MDGEAQDVGYERLRENLSSEEYEARKRKLDEIAEQLRSEDEYVQNQD